MSAGACNSGQACGVGETAPIVPLRAADFGTTVSAETTPRRGWNDCVFFMRKGGPWGESLPHPG